MKRTLTLAACAVACVAFAKQQEMMDMTPPKELKMASWLLGSWTGNEVYTMEPGAKPEKGKATVKGQWALGGRYLEGKHNMTVGGMKMEGRNLMTYDPAKKEWIAYWFDSAAPGAMKMTRTVTDKMATMTSEPMEMPGMPGMQVMRATWTKTGAKKMHFVLSMKAGDKWNTFMTGDYIRK